MIWTIWINFLPLSHGGSTWNLASVGPVVSEKIFENTHTHTHTFLHTRTQQLKVVPNEGGGGAGLWRQSITIFLLGVAGLFVLFCFFNPVGSWLLWKCTIFCRWWSFSKMQFVQMGSVGMKKKKFLFLEVLEEGSPEKNELCECHSGGVDW